MKIKLLFTSLLFSVWGLNVNAQWQPTNCPQGNNINSLLAFGTDIFAGTQGAGVYLSTDSGATWTTDTNGLNTHYFVHSLVASGTYIFAGTYGGVFLSTDSGSNWTAVSNGLPNYYTVNSLAISGSNIFAGTDHGVFFTTDTGANWTAVNNGLTGTDTIINCIAVNGTNIFAGTDSGGVFLSTNTGASWTAVNSGLTSLYIHSLLIIGTDIFAGTFQGGVCLSTDSGLSWTAVNTGLTAGSSVWTLVASGTNIFAGTFAGVFLSTNAGGKWTAINSGLTHNDYDVLSLAVSKTNIFLGNANTKVFKLVLSDVILSTENIGDNNNNNFVIYPNPATNQLTIHSSSFQNEAVRVSIMNVLGQETPPPAPLLTISGQVQRSGESAIIDITNLPAGIYFVQLTSEKQRWVGKFIKE